MKQKVLAVDDMHINLEILGAILSDDYQYTACGSGREALNSLLSDTLPDIVILDLSMPEMDGFELLGIMKKSKKLASIPVIFVTAETDEYSEEKGLLLGAVDYIKKPYNQAIIRAKIRNHIELKTYRDNLELAVAARTKELNARKEELVATHGAIIMGMSLLSESRDSITGAHLTRIKALTRCIAKTVSEMNPGLLTPEQLDEIIAYSPLHDVGKVAVPDAVLNKVGMLTDEEFDIMKTHTTSGGDLLRQTAGFLTGDRVRHLDIAIEIAECHHERFDGSGYPHGYKAYEIPLSARIVTISDIYDALRSSRPYKDGFSHERACDIILHGDGRTLPQHFDSDVLSAFEKSHSLMAKAYESSPDPLSSKAS